MEYTKSSHYIYHCRYHVIIVTKYRRAVFNDGTYEFFNKCVQNICHHHPQIEIVEMNHDKDHVHILISIPPSQSVGGVVRHIKSQTGRLMKREFAFIKKLYYGSDGIWSDGYFVSTAGVDEAGIREYIKHQGNEDLGQTKFAF